MVKYRTTMVKKHPRKQHFRTLRSGKTIRVRKTSVQKHPRHLPPKITQTDFKHLRERRELIAKKKQQVEEKDWAHLSIKYPNIIGLTDEQINRFIDSETKRVYELDTKWNDTAVNNFYYYQPKKEEVITLHPEIKAMALEEFSRFVRNNYPGGPQQLREAVRKSMVEKYIAKIKCYNKNDLEELSVKAYKDFWSDLNTKQSDLESKHHAVKAYDENYTIYLTSPRGGFDTLSSFAYANHLEKKHTPFDLYPDNSEGPLLTTVGANSLPYGSKIPDVGDIVYIDDICMSGEQQTKAYDEIIRTIETLKIPIHEYPRLHYIALAGSDKVIKEESGRRRVVPEEETERPWESVTIGEVHNIERNPKTYEYHDISAIVFPFSIPDGERHRIARELYRSTDRYRHLG